MEQPARKSPETNRQQSQRPIVIKPANDNKPQLPVEEQSKGRVSIGDLVGRGLGKAAFAATIVFKPSSGGSKEKQEAFNKRASAYAEKQRQAQEHKEQKAAIAKTQHDRETLQEKLEALLAKGQQEAARVKAQVTRMEEKQHPSLDDVTRQQERERSQEAQRITGNACVPVSKSKGLENELLKQESRMQTREAMQDNFKKAGEKFEDVNQEKLDAAFPRLQQRFSEVGQNPRTLSDHYHVHLRDFVAKNGLEKAISYKADLEISKKLIDIQKSRADEAGRQQSATSPGKENIVDVVREKSPFVHRCDFELRDYYAKKVVRNAFDEWHQKQNEKPENAQFKTKEAPEVPTHSPTIER